jgi:hypothetical protein
MTNPSATPAPTSPQPITPNDPEPILSIQRSWKIASIIAGIMVLLALMGVGLTTTGESAAAPYPGFPR